MGAPARDAWLAPLTRHRLSPSTTCPPGTGFSALEKGGAKWPSKMNCAVSETGRHPIVPRIGGNLPVSRNAPQMADCVVADAVDIEPVSASNFPDNREKYREFCQFEGVLRI